MRHLNPEDIDQLITISGMVIRTSHIIPEMREGGCGLNVKHSKGGLSWGGGGWDFAQVPPASNSNPPSRSPTVPYSCSHIIC